VDPACILLHVGLSLQLLQRQQNLYRRAISTCNTIRRHGVLELHSSSCGVQGELQGQSPAGEDAGPFSDAGVGSVVRLQRRVHQEADPTVLNLGHSLWGQSQMAVVQVRTRSTASTAALLKHATLVSQTCMGQAGSTLSAAACKIPA
jgi:hypothetical protein